MERYCIQCGNPTKPQAENHFVCSNGHHNFVDAVPSAVGYVIDSVGRVLFGVRSRDPYRGKLNPPGGFLDINENAEQGLHRELREELGIEVEILDYLGSYATHYGEGGQRVLNIVFIVKQLHGLYYPRR